MEKVTSAANGSESVVVQSTARDLRKLTLPELREALVRFGVQESEIDQMSRWTQVDRLRELRARAENSQTGNT